MNEYNQCQTQLKHLYAKGLKGHESEFVAYRILYYVYLLGNKKYHNGGSDLAFIMQSLLPNPDLRNNPAVTHALKVQKAVRTDNYYSFFQLLKLTPNMGNCILNMMLDSFRLQTLQRICKSFKPTVGALFVILQLGLDPVLVKTTSHKKKHVVHTTDALEFLRKAGCVLVNADEATTSLVNAESGNIAYEEGKWEINTKDTVIDFSAVFTQDKLLL